MSGTNGVTLGGKGTWGTCILLSIGVKDNPATLAHELGHALCLVHQDNDSDVTVANLMWDTKDQRTGTELTLDQINRASECAPQLVGQPHDSDGSLSGASDIVVGSVNTGAGLFYCIAKTDHEASTNLIATWLQCNIDIEEGGVAPNPAVPPTWDDTCDS
ncbi:MAG: hypothetical protein IIC91_11465, partial [Chloroflexi bacterium]|nr:hypothetical protein [Chloroflexota bacterium]